MRHRGSSDWWLWFYGGALFWRLESAGTFALIGALPEVYGRKWSARMVGREPNLQAATPKDGENKKAIFVASHFLYDRLFRPHLVHFGLLEPFIQSLVLQICCRLYAPVVCPK